MRSVLVYLLVIVACAFRARGEVTVSMERVFNGVCDASAGAALSADLFAAADDESNKIRVYSFAKGGAPLFEMSVDRFLGVERREPEADIEGAARVGEMIYWIGSHARNQKGQPRSSRQRFFATRVVSIAPPKLEPFGQAYDGLLQDFEADARLDRFDLEEASALAPKEKNALNIEGLCAGPNGSLLIGFRNPLPQKLALVVPLLNPAELVSGNGVRAKLGAPIRLDLDGRGIRDMVLSDRGYYIIAGAYNSANRFELYHWDGQQKVKLLHRWEKHSINPEAILALPERMELLVLSDESGRDQGSKPCKDAPVSQRHFRGVLVVPPG